MTGTGECVRACGTGDGGLVIERVGEWHRDQSKAHSSLDTVLWLREHYLFLEEDCAFLGFEACVPSA